MLIALDQINQINNSQIEVGELMTVVIGLNNIQPLQSQKMPKN